jgi:xanthine dehydrogenase accessory factor
MRTEVSHRADELRSERVPYVHARVVLAEKPTSAHPGDEALVLGDGTIDGFVGGTCAESTVRSHGLALLDSGDSELLRISPDPVDDSSPAPGRVVVHNPCLSGGTLEIFLEPVLPTPLVFVHGSTPIAAALVRLGDALGYEMRALPIASEELVSGASAVVVASHGRDEEEVLTAALHAGVPYIGLVASRKRGAAVLASLDPDGRDAPHPPDPLPPDRISTPAGLDIGARTPEEVALSILAEVVASRPRPVGRPVVPEQQAAAVIATDPVCGMSVASVDSSLHLDFADENGVVVRHWFCGSGCLRAFAADPSAYTEQPA